MEMQIRIGTSGWNYPHWRKVFYPPGLPSSRWLAYYAKYFDTVEVNATFYGTPKSKTLARWYEATPAEFVFALKASRFITHIKRLRDAEAPLRRFYETIRPLKEKIGPILFQLPPSLKFDPHLIADFLALLDPHYLHTMEIRHQSFHNDTFLELLREKRVALCLSDTAGRYPSLLEAITADFVYVRLHGSRRLYYSCYTEEELSRWAEKLRKWNQPGYVYFDNDALGWAVPNALRLKELLGQHPPPLPEEAHAILSGRPLD